MYKEQRKAIYFAGGCFWGVEKYFANQPFVLATQVGYANGILQDINGKSLTPNYNNIAQGTKTFAETVEINYNADGVSLTTLTKRFFDIIDPISINKQGNDIGEQYRTGIYYTNNRDLKILKAVWDEVSQKYSQHLACELKPLENFYPAEIYHQKYLNKNPNGYCHINLKYLNKKFPLIDKALYPIPDKAKLKKQLNQIQYSVTQENSTEKAFTGQTVNEFSQGIYVDITNGQPLFISDDKFPSNCGWPSFSKPIDEAVIDEKYDNSIPNMPRVEVRSSSNSHLGHVFNDGPDGGLRYCINSASLKFIKRANMETSGYGYLLYLFN
ncbi:MAG: peptide-methionine (R)-S-oxide reductase MsrB [Bifidobacteriaceae bacterium]|jgi:peptide methionine sulfoxide reductase msrA/msrB|nr:peptide-methionine (R)-S-oxide reductase MsrB [Bifidobacteriaceae bacterium]